MILGVYETPSQALFRAASMPPAVATGCLAGERAGRLALARLLVDERLEGFGGERPFDDALADHEGRRDVHSEGSREGQVGLQGLVGRRRHHVRLELPGVEPDRCAELQEGFGREISL